MKLSRLRKKIREHSRRSFLLSLGISCFSLGAALFYSENQPAAAYEQFLEIDYLTALLEERPSPESISDLGLDLIKRSDRVNQERSAINRKRRRENVIVTEETRKVFSPDQGAMVDEVRKVTTRLPDSAIDLLSMMVDSSALETKRVPLGSRDKLSKISFDFDFDDSGDERLAKITLVDVPEFFGIDFSQFEKEADVEEIKETLIVQYGLDAHIRDVSAIRRLFFVHEGFEFYISHTYNPNGVGITVQALEP
ncbi:Tat pathway signal sequence domain protein [Enterococcus casseliflavus]|uniref:Tat pathway signal sequence domain protein n=1 Tax=unclassified Enterococcus TaxID=2608891 RepID=UPI001883F56B|nr:Tat pathway signal sequence domain protein [Enterococcus casseliflavus]